VVSGGEAAAAFSVRSDQDHEPAPLDGDLVGNGLDQLPAVGERVVEHCGHVLLLIFHAGLSSGSGAGRATAYASAMSRISKHGHGASGESHISPERE